MAGGPPATPPDDDLRRLRVLWGEHRRIPFPSLARTDPRLHELALYDSWVSAMVEQSLVRGGKLTVGHRAMLEQRREEGSRELWAVAAELGDPVRGYLARLLAMEDILERLPVESLS